MEDRVELYKDAEAIALTRMYRTSYSSKRQGVKSYYFVDSNNRTDRKIDYKMAQQVANDKHHSVEIVLIHHFLHLWNRYRVEIIHHYQRWR